MEQHEFGRLFSSGDGGVIRLQILGVGLETIVMQRNGLGGSAALIETSGRALNARVAVGTAVESGAGDGLLRLRKDQRCSSRTAVR